MKVIFTCGGTAGHVNPALAVAQIFQVRHPGCEILFIGAEKGMERRLVEQAGYPIRVVTVSTFERAWNWKVIKHNIGSAFKVFTGRRQAAAILKEFKPDLVVGTGGYASFPAVREAARMGIPCAIHESNAYPGLTTRTLANKVNLVMVGFPEAKSFYQGPSGWRSPAPRCGASSSPRAGSRRGWSWACRTASRWWCPSGAPRGRAT